MNVVNRASIALGLAIVLPACTCSDKRRRSAKDVSPPGDPILPAKLIALLPRIEGWDATPPESNTRSLEGRQVSLVSARYSRKVDGKDQSVRLELVDGNGASSVFTPFALMAHSQGEAMDAHKRSINIKGNPGLESWDPAAGRVTAMLMAARRFRVTLNGAHIAPETVEQFLTAIDETQLARWSGTAAPQ